MLAFEQKSQTGMSVFKFEIYMAWKINKDLLSTPKPEEWCWQTAENYTTFK